MKKVLSMVLALILVLSLAAPTDALAASKKKKAVNNTEAPRSYLPYAEDLDKLPEDSSLPDLFTFFDKSADPNGNGRVDTPEEWDARAAEIRDMAQYYIYGSRLDPLKSDTQITAIRRNYEYVWADGIMAGPKTMFGYNALPNLPEGSYTMTTMDFSRWGMGLYYNNFAPAEGFVYEGEGFDMPEGTTAWKKGDTWAEHADAVTRVTLPKITVEMTIKDTNPANAEWVDPVAAKEGVKWTFDVRVPSEAVTVDGQVRDEHSSRNGIGYPLLVAISGLSEQQIVTLNNNGYAYIQVNDTADPDNGQVSVYEKLYPPKDIVVHNDNTTINPYMLDSGDLMHSAWIASRALDAIENYMKLSSKKKAKISSEVILPDIDVNSSAVTGCSNNGKRALAAALYDNGNNGDTRFDIAAPCDSGSAGMVGFRYLTEGELFSYEPPLSDTAGTVMDYPYGVNETLQRAIQNTGEDQWFSDRAQIFTVRPDLVDNTPIDMHSIVASFATSKEERYVITWSGEGTNGWGNHPAVILTALAAKEAFEYLGQGGNVTVIARDLAHANQDRDLPELMAIMDHLFYGAEGYTRKYQSTLADATGIKAKDGSGTILPTKTFDTAFEMSRYPYYFSSAAMKWSRPGKFTLWTEQNNVTEGVGMTFEFHTDAPYVKLTLTDGTVLKAKTKNGIAKITITADQAKAGRYSATAYGKKKDNRTIDICGWTINDALRTAITDNSALGHDVGSGICFTTRLTNYDDKNDPVLLYMNGEAVPTDLYDYDNKITLEDGTVVPQSGYLQPFGATLMLYEGTMGYNVPMGDKVVFSVRNAKIEALQGFILSLDMEFEKFCPSGTRMRFKTTYNTLTTQTPVWEPELRQNTPALGLPKDEDRWPIIGNWMSDYNEDGTFKDTDEIRPLNSAEVKSEYNAEITVSKATRKGFTVSFSKPVNKNDFAIAINTVTGYTYKWNSKGTKLTVTYDKAVKKGTEVTAYIFRSVDKNGNMIGGPVKLTAKAK